MTYFFTLWFISNPDDGWEIRVETTRSRCFSHLSLSSPDSSVPSGASVRPPSLCSLLSYPFPTIFISSFELNHIFGVFLKFINPVSLKSQKEGISERQPEVAGAGAGKARAASPASVHVSVTFASLDRST